MWRCVLCRQELEKAGLLNKTKIAEGGRKLRWSRLALNNLTREKKHIWLPHMWWGFFSFLALQEELEPLMGRPGREQFSLLQGSQISDTFQLGQKNSLFCCEKEIRSLKSIFKKKNQSPEHKRKFIQLFIYFQQKPGNSRPESSVDLRGAQLHWANELSSKKNVFKVTLTLGRTRRTT